MQKSAPTDESLAISSIETPADFAILVERYEAKLTRYIRRIAGVSKEDIEDILQEVFLKAYKNLNGFDPSLSFSSWMYRIAHNHTRSHFRKVQARPKQTAIDDVIINKLSNDEDLAGSVDLTLGIEKMTEALETLDEKYRTVIVLKYLEEKDYQEMSDILQKPVGTIGTLLNRAKKKLKKELGL